MGDSSLSAEDIDNLLSGDFGDTMPVPETAQPEASQPAAAGASGAAGDDVFNDLDALIGGGVPDSAPTPAAKAPAGAAPPAQKGKASDIMGLGNMAILKNVIVNLNVELGKKERLIKDILALGEGSIIELDKSANDLVDILANNRVIARGEVVVVDEQFGVRITEMVDPLKERD